MPRTSVLVRCYRQAEYLPESIGSVVAQEHPDLEVVVVDDGSPDGVREAVVALAQKNPQVNLRLLSQENQGLSGALNAGVRAALGERVIFLDADDQLLPGALARLEAALDHRPDAGIAYGDVVTFGGREGIVPAGSWDPAALARANRLPYASLYRRENWRRVGGYQRNLSFGYEDWDFWVACAEHGLGAVKVDGPVLRYRVKAESACTLAERHHDLLRARVMLNHPRFFAEPELRAARTSLESRVAELVRERLAAGDLPGARRALAVSEERSLDLPAVGYHEAPWRYRVTAIVSAFRSSRYLRGCLQDLTEQTLFARGQLEIVVVDTGSPEDEAAIVRDFAGPHLRYLRTPERRTLYAAWNLGILAAQGRYLTNANADDRHRPDALEVMADSLDRHPEVALVYADQIYSQQENDTLATTRSRRRRLWPPYSYSALRSHCMVGCQPMWRRALHDRYGTFDATLASAGDWEFWLRIGKTEPFLKIPEVLGLYYENPAGLENSHPASAAEAERVRARHGIAPAERASSGFETWVKTPLPDAAPPAKPAAARSTSTRVALADVIRAG